MTIRIGDRLTHRFNPELGPGQVIEVVGRDLVVHFPKADTTLRFSARTDALAPLVLRAGARVRVIEDGRSARIESLPSPGIARLDDGSEVSEDELWPVDTRAELLERLVTGDIDSREAFRLQLDALRLQAYRTTDQLASFLGGRIRLFPHQLYTAERATRADPVRWLLADEVGLGKTVESCLILNHLLHTGRAERTLVVAPETLTVQWLGELWRKYHQIFVLLDDKRLRDVERDFGKDFNPFDAHHQVVVSQELLEGRPELARQAAEGGLDLVIVDEAHRLRRKPGHPGNAAYRSLAPITAAVRHALLLTAIPLEDDTHGFFRLLELLLPDRFESFESFAALLDTENGLPPCTSATRRIDIGGLPPRIGQPIDLDAAKGEPFDRLLRQLAASPAGNPIERRDKARRIRRALSSGAALRALPEVARNSELIELSKAAERADPRVDWITEQAPSWLAAGDKTLIFVAHRETLDWLKTALNRYAALRAGVFHEDLSIKQRDVEVAQFRTPGGPPILISTECGGEGRNFEFCRRLVLFDLPWSPLVVEQRIGRLDRIGRQGPVEIVYFRPARGPGAVIASLYEELGLFRQPMSGLERELSGVAATIESLAAEETSGIDATWRERFGSILQDAEDAYDRVQKAAYHELHRDPYRPELATAILDRIPPDLESLTRDVVVGACHELGLRHEEHQAGARHSIRLDPRARVESLPGLIGEASFLGTFSREIAVENEQLDFFAYGHPLVEGLLAHLDEDPLGRVALLRCPADGVDKGFGLLALFRSDYGFEAIAIDGKGKERPEWSRQLLETFESGPRVRAEDWVGKASWPRVIRELGKHLEGRGRPLALAFFRIG
jgi:ATP-dependent helicase HepA